MSAAAIMPLSFAAGACVDEGIKAVEKSVAEVDDVGLFEMNVDVRIRVGGGKVLERERFAIGLQFVAGGEGLLRQSIGRRGREMYVENRNVLRLRTCAFWCFRGRV